VKLKFAMEDISSSAGNALEISSSTAYWKVSTAADKNSDIEFSTVCARANSKMIFPLPVAISVVATANLLANAFEAIVDAEIALLTDDAIVLIVAPEIAPMGPTDPSEPVVPIGPDTPGAPLAPMDPAGPIGPVVPVAPIAPGGPRSPVAPFNPLTALAPLGPVAPCAPIAP